MARKNNYFRRQPETKAIPIRKSEFKIKKLEKQLPFGDSLKIVTKNGTKCILRNADYSSDEWDILWDCLSEEDSVIVRYRASKIVEAYVTVTKSYHILKDIKCDDQKAGYCFVFPEMDFFLSKDDFCIRNYFWDCWRDYEKLEEDQKLEKLKKEFLGEQAEIFWINKRVAKMTGFLHKF